MPTITELLKHKTVLASLGVTGLILAGSVAYYLVAINPPPLTYAEVTRGPITETVTGNGTVSPGDGGGRGSVTRSSGSRASVSTGRRRPEGRV